MRLLVIEDDASLAELVREALASENFAADLAADGKSGYALLRQGCYDACILDRMLPEMDGLTLLSRVRAEGNTTPVLILTALGRTQDLVEGFAGGADDYLTKPFAMPELLARVTALVRRRSGRYTRTVTAGDLTFDPEKLTLSGPDGSCSLTEREGELLALLLRRPGEIISRETFFGNVWGLSSEVSEASLDTYVYFLRRRLRSVGTRWQLSTRRGRGYLLEEKA